MAHEHTQSKAVKRQALELLEWALFDMSSDPRRPLHFKCGFEREGHFIPRDLSAIYTKREWLELNKSHMTNTAKKMHYLLQKNPDMERIYYDEAGTFLLEGVTRPLGLAQAPQAIERISDAMLASAERLQLHPAKFGAVPIGDFIDRQIEIMEQNALIVFEHGPFSGHEVFGEGEDRMLVSRGQHCNLSLWVGNTNLFADTANKADLNLLHHAAVKALEWLPYMFMMCRVGHYDRIRAMSANAVHNFSVGGPDSYKTAHVIRYTANNLSKSPDDFDDDPEYDPKTYRLEFRQGTSAADPYDLAIVSAVPLVAACDEYTYKENGKIISDRAGRPKMKSACDFPYHFNNPLPREESEAKEAFNRFNNPYFVYLDALAERKIQRTNQTGTRAEQILAQKLRGIGTRLSLMYCKQYGLQNIMPLGSLLNAALPLAIREY